MDTISQHDWARCRAFLRDWHARVGHRPWLACRERLCAAWMETERGAVSVEWEEVEPWMRSQWSVWSGHDDDGCGCESID